MSAERTAWRRIRQAGLLTGFHEPRASHLHVLEAVTGRRHLAISYGAALKRGTCGTSSEICT
jgi:S-adenosylmethionine:tRNA-ribosyltransferase-isomerase (queuine synthetase)